MPNLFSKVTYKSWTYLIKKLRYLTKECKKKDIIIKAYEEQMRILKANFSDKTKDV